MRAILCQLKSSEPKSVELAMAMLETCIKNCNSIPSLVSRSVMEEIVHIANGKRGHRNQDEALRLIQSWGRTFEKRRSELPIFYNTFMQLKSTGAQFPQLDPQDVTTSPSAGSSRGPQRNEFVSQLLFSSPPVELTLHCNRPLLRRLNNPQSFNKTLKLCSRRSPNHLLSSFHST